MRSPAESGQPTHKSTTAVLGDPDVQAIVIATPNDTHYELAKAAIEAGKDVFCEKPMTTSPQESAELVQAMRQRPQQIFQVGYMKRYNPGFRLVKEMLPKLGDLLKRTHSRHRRLARFEAAPACHLAC